MRILLFSLLLITAPAWALQLFGIDLAKADRDALRQAVKQAGAELVREAGERQFYDAYRSKALLQDSRYLYLGFVKSDGRFAFAEYEFPGLQAPRILGKLQKRYGKPERIDGKFLSDTEYRWRQPPLEILLRQDWPAHAWRLIYLRRDQLKRLQSERAAYRQQQQAGRDKDSPQAW